MTKQRICCLEIGAEHSQSQQNWRCLQRYLDDLLVIDTHLTLPAALQAHANEPYDFFFYHVEDCQELALARLYLMLVPGVVYFSDFNFVPSEQNKMISNTQKSILSKLEGLKDPSVVEGFSNDYPEMKSSLLAFFSSQRGLSQWSRSFPEKSHLAFYLPDAICAPEAGSTLSDVREKLVIAFCGSPILESRAHVLLNVLRGIDRDFKLLWMCENHEREEVEAMLEEFSIAEAKLFSPKSEDVWLEILEQSDLAMHFWFSAYKSVGRYLFCSMRYGVPTVVSDFASASELPNEVVYKISAGATEAQQIEDLLINFKSKDARSEANEKIERARSYVSEFNSPEVLANEMRYVLRKHGDYLRSATKKWFADHQFDSIIGLSKELAIPCSPSA